MSEKTTTDKIIESQKEALAIELLARFAHKTFGRNGVWNDEVKKHFVDGALWAFSRYEAIDSVIGEQPKIDLKEVLKMQDWAQTRIDRMKDERAQATSIEDKIRLGAKITGYTEYFHYVKAII